MPNSMPRYNFSIRAAAGHAEVLSGSYDGQGMGYFVSGLGDINADGYDDVAIRSLGGTVSQIVFGSADVFTQGAGAVTSLDQSAAGEGQRVADIAAAGDINGDGIDDFVYQTNTGDVAVVFGRAEGFDTTLSSGSLTADQGWVMSYDSADGPLSLAGAGDLNGDGFDDLVIGDWRSSGDSLLYGKTVVIYGTDTASERTTSVDGISAAQGFALTGEGYPDWSGMAVSAAGDMNGDGYDDLLIGAPDSSSLARSPGHVYLVYGAAESGWTEAALSPQAGRITRIDGQIVGDGLGLSLDVIGDFNGDGLDDIVLGTQDGYAAVVYGQSGGLPEVLDLDALTPDAGLIIQDSSYRSGLGYRVAGAGDMNGDGLDDIILSYFGLQSGETQPAGEVLVIFGTSETFDSAIRTDDLTAEMGFVIEGEGASARFGFGLDGAGDLNGDGHADLLISATQRSFAGEPHVGAGYVVLFELTPEAQADYQPIAERDFLTIPVNDGSGQMNIFDNDIDFEDDTLVLVAVDGVPARDGYAGTLASGVNYTLSASGDLVVTLDGDFSALREGDSTHFTFTYSAADSQGGVVDNVAVVILAGANDAPNPVAVPYTLSQEPIQAGDAIYYINHGDPDRGPGYTYTYTLLSDNAGLIALDGYQVKLTQDMAYSRIDSLFIEVEVRDSYGLTGQVSFTWENPEVRVFAEDVLGYVQVADTAERILLTDGADTLSGSFDAFDGDTIYGFGFEDVLVAQSAGRAQGDGGIYQFSDWGPVDELVSGPTVVMQTAGGGWSEDPMIHFASPGVVDGGFVSTERDDGLHSLFLLPVLHTSGPVAAEAQGSGPSGLLSGAHMDDVAISVVRPADAGHVFGFYVLDETTGRIVRNGVLLGDTGAATPGDLAAIDGIAPGQRLGFFVVPDGTADLAGAASLPLEIVDGSLRIAGYDGAIFGSDFGAGDSGVSVLTGVDDAGRVAMRFDLGDADGLDALWLTLNFQDVTPNAAHDGHGNATTLTGTDADERFDGSSRDQTILAGGGDDTLIGTEGSDVLDGGSGTDLLIYLFPRAEAMLRRSGSDILLASQGTIDVLRGIEYLGFTDGIISIEEALGLVTDGPIGSEGGIYEGTALADRLVGRAGDDSLTGAEGNDTLIGGLGDDSLLGGLGDDLILTGHDRLTGHAYGTDYAEGGAGDDLMIGANGSATLMGGAGNDTLHGGNDLNTADVDVLNGGAGNDSLVSGQSWLPSLARQAMGDSLIGGDGDDTAEGGAANDWIEGGAGSDLLSGGGGADVIYAGLYEAVIGGGTDVAGADTLFGEAGNDTLYGADGGQWIDGGAGHDWLFGGAEGSSADSDTLLGGGGNDRLASGQVVAPDTAHQGFGDWLDGQWGADTLVGGQADDTLIGGDGTDSLLGGAGDDLIFVGTVLGEPGTTPVAAGGYGQDSASGGAGDDVIHGANGAAWLSGDAGNDTIFGGNDLHSADRDTLLGGAGDDLLVSGQVLRPTAGTEGQGDILDGGAGNDTLVGGLAADLFVFASGGGVDLVQGFTQGADLFDLTAFGSGAAVSFAQAGTDAELWIDGTLYARIEGIAAAGLGVGDYLLS